MKQPAAGRHETVNLWLSVAGQGVSSLGHYLFSFAMGLYVLSLTGSAQSYAVTVAVSLLPSAVLSPIVGALADRVSKKLLVVLSDTCNCVLLLCAFLVALARQLTVGDVYLITFLMSVISPFVNVTFTAAAPRLVSDRLLSRLTSYRTAVSSVIQVATPVLSGAVYVVLDIRLFILFSSIAYGLSALSELFIDFNFNPLAEASETRESFMQSLRSGASYLLSSRVMVAIVTLMLLVNLWFAALDAVLPYSMLEIIGLNESTYGVIMAAFSVGTLLGSVYVGRRDLRFSRRLVSVSLALCALLMVWLAIPMGVAMPAPLASVLLFTGCAAIGLVCAFINVPSSVFIQRLVPGELLGRIGGLLSTINMVMSPVGMLLFGTLADHIHPSIILMACAAMVGAVALLCRRMTSFDESAARLTQ